jgi:hypothetical protein
MRERIIINNNESKKLLHESFDDEKKKAYKAPFGSKQMHLNYLNKKLVSLTREYDSFSRILEHKQCKK